MKKMPIPLSLFLMIFIYPLRQAQEHHKITCPPAIEYGNRNQVTPASLKISTVKGRVIAEGGTAAKDAAPVPACLGLFREDDHQLVASTTADEKGRFEFESISAGLYRLVVRDPQNAFCVANVPLQIVRSQRGKPLVIHLRPSGVDTCSYGDLK